MLNDVINSINAVIVEKFPSVPVEVNNQGEGFKRPSFFITNIQESTEDLTRWIYNNNMLIQIVYFAPLDDYNNVDSINQNDTSDTLKKAFAQGFIKVGDRAAKIKKITGGPRDAEVYLTLDIDLTDERIDTSEPAPIAGSVKINIKGGED
jgi:hypothetical protein